MAHHKDAIKRMRQSQKRRLYNRHYRAGMRTQIKVFRAAVADNNVELASSELNKTVSIIQKLAGKKVLHKRNASRRVARLYKAVNKIKAAAK